MLRLVHPAHEGQGTRPPARRKGARSAALSLTPDETRHVRAAIRNAARAYGGLDCLAAVMGIPAGSLRNIASTRGPATSAALALAVARASGVSVEAVLTGALGTAGRCPTCGHRAGDGRVAAAGGAR